jgi:hypothetical protein
MPLIANAMITIVRTRPHPLLTFRSHIMPAVIIFPWFGIDRSTGCWWGWAGLYEG